MKSNDNLCMENTELNHNFAGIVGIKYLRERGGVKIIKIELKKEC